MDVDQELSILEDRIRRLKIEYEIFFNGGTSRMPYDLRWKVENIIKKYGDHSNMTFAQRFHYNTLVAKFHSYLELWRRTIKNREEGKPTYAHLVTHEAASEEESPTRSQDDRLVCQLVCSDPESEAEKLENLFKSLLEAKRECGERTDTVQFQAFRKFILEKTAKLKEQFNTSTVCYTVSIEAGKVKLTAKGKV
jgi:hypothetical protein